MVRKIKPKVKRVTTAQEIAAINHDLDGVQDAHGNLCVRVADNYNAQTKRISDVASQVAQVDALRINALITVTKRIERIERIETVITALSLTLLDVVDGGTKGTKDAKQASPAPTEAPKASQASTGLPEGHRKVWHKISGQPWFILGQDGNTVWAKRASISGLDRGIYLASEFTSEYPGVKVTDRYVPGPTMSTGTGKTSQKTLDILDELYRDGKIKGLPVANDPLAQRTFQIAAE